ncbi:MAG TPA: urate hydroxylase PuuD [Candidatus Baltobacteraceae bacterium]|nr:urate hydroxylase PuuD [Candidatus Baltobacteraceae bacterium]
MLSPLAIALLAAAPHFSFPQGPVANEEIALRWLHFVSGIIWIGLLYFFNLIATPTMKALDPPVRGKVFPPLMERAMWWFRWSAVVTVLVGLRYFWIILAADANNAGQPSLALRWMGLWLVVWLVAFALIYPLQLPRTGFLDSAWVRTIAIAAIVVAASWAALYVNASPESSNAQLSISVGGGIGLLLLLNVWGVVWRAQKRLIAWTRASAEQGTPMPPEAARLARWSFLASRVGFWLSFPMLFFMAAAEHYPFLSGVVK